MPPSSPTMDLPMNSIVTQLRTPSFWVLGVFLALILNMVSTLALRSLEKGWLSGRTALAERSKRAKSKRFQRVAEMAKNIDHLHHTREKLQGYRFSALFTFLMGIWFLVSPSLSGVGRLFGVLSNLLVVIAVVLFSLSLSIEKDVAEAYLYRDLIGFGPQV